VRLSPTLFYSMLGGVASEKQAETMVLKHLRNESEFCVTSDSKKCPFAIPSIARNDPAFPDNDYWRGRIWGPMSFLTYLSLRSYEGQVFEQARKDLCSQTNRLLLQNWLAYGHVQENYNAVTGEGCDVGNADAFYHWGALNGFVCLMEAGFISPW